MDIESKIQSYLQEGEIYQSQALFDEARKRYAQATKLIKNSPGLKNKKALMEIVSKKMNSLNFSYNMFQRIEASAQMSNTERDHILNQLLPPGRKSTGSAELEWAGALLSFGEFEMALNEFNKLLIREPALRVTAAKNILKCHTKLSSFDMAKTQYEMWTSGDLFTPTQLQRVKTYLENSIDPAMKEAISLADMDIEATQDQAPAVKIPSPPKRPLPRNGTKQQEKGIIEKPSPIPVTVIPDDAITEIVEDQNGDTGFATLISEAEATAEDGPNQILSMSIPLTTSVNEVGLEVNYQREDRIRGIVPREDSVLIPRLEIGRRLEDVRFYSSYTMIVGACIIHQRIKILSGPNRGQFALHLQVVDPFKDE